MKRKLLGIIIFMIILIMGYNYFDNNYSNDGILRNVENRDGYHLNLINEQVPINLFIKPEWIPFDSTEDKKLNEKLLTLHGTIIILDNIWNRGNDISFSFHTEYNMDYNGGFFMYNGLLNEDGSFTYTSIPSDTVLRDINQKIFEVEETGSGGDSSFSFSVVPKYYESIEEGFYVEYTGFMLYEYIKQ